MADGSRLLMPAWWLFLFSELRTGLGIILSLPICIALEKPWRWECSSWSFYTREILTKTLKYIWFLEVIYVILTSIMKASIATTLLTWAKSKVHIYLLWTAIALDTIICLVVTFYIVFQCSPVSYAWTRIDPTVKGTCQPFTGQLYMGYALCIVTISIDMLFLFVPFFMLKGRGVSSRIKTYIYSILGLGVLWVLVTSFIIWTG